MKVAVRDLAAAGQQPVDLAERLLDALAGGMVLFNRKVTLGTGIEARKILQTWVLVRPVVIDGILRDLVENAETDAANKVGKFRYGLRPSDVRMRMLRQITTDVYWLGPHGAQHVVTTGRRKPIDMWSQLRPSTVNVMPGFETDRGRTQEFVRKPGTDPQAALKNLSKGDRHALAALLEGLHLVDAQEMVDAAGRRSERRTWRPLRPVMDEEGRPAAYEYDARVARHTVNAGRNGFSPKTFAAISPLLVEAGYDPSGEEFGHAYRLADEWTNAAREAIGWVPETDAGEHEPQARSHKAVQAADEPSPEPNAAPSPREDAIVSMLEGRPFDSDGVAPSYREVAAAIANHVADPARCAALIEAALSQAAAGASANGSKTRRSPLSWLRR